MTKMWHHMMLSSDWWTGFKLLPWALLLSSQTLGGTLFLLLSIIFHRYRSRLTCHRPRRPPGPSLGGSILIQSLRPNTWEQLSANSAEGCVVLRMPSSATPKLRVFTSFIHLTLMWARPRVNCHPGPSPRAWRQPPALWNCVPLGSILDQGGSPT